MSDKLNKMLEDNALKTGADRVTEQDVLNEIAEERYLLGSEALGVGADHPLACLTLCLLVMKNGFTIHGHSACADPKGFNAEIGRTIAKRNAVSVAWGHMGYELRTKLAAKEQAESLTFKDRVRIERAELAEKVDKLGAYLAGPDVVHQLRDVRDELAEQHAVMMKYLSVLDKRIKRF